MDNLIRNTTNEKPFELTYSTDGVYLTVYRNPYSAVSEIDVINEIRRKKIRNSMLPLLRIQ